MNQSISVPFLFRLALLLVVIGAISGAAFSSAGASGGYSVTWYTFDGGGGTSSNPVYTLTGTLGQPDAGSHSGTGYDLTGGFWAWITRYLDFLPLLRKP